MSASGSGPSVAELQGLYGAFSFPEKLLQQLWSRGEFGRAAAATLDGRRVQVLHPGKWNQLGGPDFLRARLRFDDGPEITGDIEVHLQAPDWDAHGHARDRAYDHVILHVVLFPPDEGRKTLDFAGSEIATLVLLPLLHYGLEEIAAEAAVEALSGLLWARLPEEMSRLPVSERGRRLRRYAEARWRQKVRFARLRLQRLGWSGAGHATMLEILGYRFNRVPMLRVAGRWPPAMWTDGTVNPDDA